MHITIWLQELVAEFPFGYTVRAGDTTSLGLMEQVSSDWLTLIILSSHWSSAAPALLACQAQQAVHSDVL